MLRSSSITKVIDLAFLDDEDVESLLGGDEPMEQLGLKLRRMLWASRLAGPG